MFVRPEREGVVVALSGSSAARADWQSRLNFQVVGRRRVREAFALVSYNSRSSGPLLGQFGSAIDCKFLSGRPDVVSSRNFFVQVDGEGVARGSCSRRGREPRDVVCGIGRAYVNVS